MNTDNHRWGWEEVFAAGVPDEVGIRGLGDSGFARAGRPGHQVVSDVRDFVWSNFYEAPLVIFFRMRRFFPHELSQKNVFLFDPIENFL